MITAEQHFIADADRRRTRIEAQAVYEESEERLATLIFEVNAIGRRAAKISTISRAIEVRPAEPLQSESKLLMLAPSDFENLKLDSIRELGNAIVVARREVAEAKALALALGCKL
jgi:hypothetical protein